MKTELFKNNFGDEMIGYSRADLTYFGNWKATGSSQNLENIRDLISQFETWAKAQGASEVFGPIDGSTLGSYRFRIDHFEETPFWGEPANSSEEVALIQSLGYEIAEKYYSYVCHDLTKLMTLTAELEKKIPAAMTADLVFNKIDLTKWSELEERLCLAANKIFAKNFGFTQISVEQFRQVYQPSVRSLICTETSILVENQKKEVIGACLNFKNPNNPSEILIKTVGVVEEYRRMGFVFFEMIKRLLISNHSYKSAILCLMREGNVPSLFLKDFADEVRQYALFRKNL